MLVAFQFPKFVGRKLVGRIREKTKVAQTRACGWGLGRNPYNDEMPTAVFEEMKRYIGFDERDAANLRAIGPVVEPHFTAVVDSFYKVLLRHPGAAAVFSGQDQIERLRVQLKDWLRTLFSGCYDSAYCRHRSEIGRTHVRVGLAQHYMFAAIDVIRQELQNCILVSDIADPQPKLESLLKLLTLETGIMLETYKESYSEQVRDMERVALRERLVRAEHLAQIGQLAASLAHEIKNPLAGISGAVQVIRDKTPANDSRQPVLTEILRQIERLDGTVEDLLIYARPKPANFHRCNLPEVICRAVEVLKQQPQVQRIQLEYSTADGLPPIEVDADQIEQVLINIVLNAAHASLNGQTVRVHARPSADGIEIVVADEGQGMSEAVRKRAFEPFFTTKVRGTGLGLAICQQIVSAHGGLIELDSAPGEGTRVSLQLPFSRGKQPTEWIDVDTGTDCRR